MPFITLEKRVLMEQLRQDLGGKDLHTALAPPLDVGDWCYYYYKPLVDAWRQNPRWKTADRLYRELLIEFSNPQARFALSTLAARALAWQVFFQLHVMPYELKKREENGDI